MAPLYDFICEGGHVTEKFFRMTDEPKTADCAQCEQPTRRLFSNAAVIDDFPEHYNLSLGRVVKGRQHLRELQKTLNCQDYEPGPERPHFSRMRKEGLL